jgi:hypothetical protein
MDIKVKILESNNLNFKIKLNIDNKVSKKGTVNLLMPLKLIRKMVQLETPLANLATMN